MSENTPKTALTIAGSDCSGGAGIQADLKTFCAHNVYGMSVITSVIAENTAGVLDITKLDYRSVGMQLKAVFEDIFPDSVKIGMLYNIDVSRAVCEGLRRYKPHNIVIDPVMLAKDGTALTSESNIEYMIENIFTFADLLTPNIPEAERIAHMNINIHRDMEKSCEKIHSMGVKAILLKGGHFDGEPSDILYDGNDFSVYTSKRINTKNTHGTGCTLSSAIAANLSLGYSLKEAVGRAKEYIFAAIEHSFELGKGNGPLNHMYTVFGGGNKNV